MAARSPRHNTGPAGQSICGERMRSPAPGQRLQVTGGILKFTIYQGPFVERCRSAKWRRWGRLNLDTLASNSFCLLLEQPGPAFIKRLKSQQSCSPGVQTKPPVALTATHGDRLIPQVVERRDPVARRLQCRTDCGWDDEQMTSLNPQKDGN